MPHPVGAHRYLKNCKFCSQPFVVRAANKDQLYCTKRCARLDLRKKVVLAVAK